MAIIVKVSRRSEERSQQTNLERRPPPNPARFLNGLRVTTSHSP